MSGAHPGGLTRVAAIDCGTNTLRLLIADIDLESVNPVHQVLREMRTVRLGEGVEATGRFASTALARTREALIEYAAMIAEHDVQNTRMVATSATRDAANRSELFDIVASTVATRPEVISGDQEGRLTFRGVLSGLTLDGPSTVVDIGGGSTELFVGDASGVDRGVSMNIGVVRLTERHVRSDPPLRAELERIEQDVATAVREALVEINRPVTGPLIGVAGTATTAAALAHRMPGYDPKLIHGLRTPYGDLVEVADWAARVDTAARAAHPAMHPGRAGVFPAGMVILRTVMATLGADALTVSESDILDGIALSIAEGQ